MCDDLIHYIQKMSNELLYAQVIQELDFKFNRVIVYRFNPMTPMSDEFISHLWITNSPRHIRQYIGDRLSSEAPRFWCIMHPDQALIPDYRGLPMAYFSGYGLLSILLRADLIRAARHVLDTCSPQYYKYHKWVVDTVPVKSWNQWYVAADRDYQE